MFIDDQTYTQNGKIYRRALLRNSYRVNGKVHHDTVANLSQCSEEEIEAIKFALKHKGDLKKLVKATGKVKTKQGLAVGAVWVLKQLVYFSHSFFYLNLIISIIFFFVVSFFCKYHQHSSTF